MIESLRLKRKAVGVDLNPLATFITTMESSPLDIDRFRKSKEVVSRTVKDEILSFYVTRCPECGSNRAR